jgi:hypothetical protein
MSLLRVIAVLGPEVADDLGIKTYRHSALTVQYATAAVRTDRAVKAESMPSHRTQAIFLPQA